MNGSDSFQLVINEIGKSLTNITDTFALVGLLYTGKLTLKYLSSGLYVIKTYLIPKLFKNDKWLKSLGNWAIVTGSTHGIGLAYAKELAKRGINLILIARNDDLLTKVSKNLEEKYKVKIITICADFNDIESIDKIEKVVLAKDIGILVNNVGTSNEPSFFHLTSPDLIDRMINVNIRTLSQMTRLILPEMVKKNKGAIVNVSSGITFTPGNLFAVYASTKAYTDKLTEVLRYEYRKTKIVFQCINPGLVTTQMSVKNVGKSKLSFNIDAIKYTSCAISTLGYSNYTAGHWLHGLQYFIISTIPKFILNPFFVHQSEKILLKNRNNHQSTSHYNYDDIDIILNTD